MSVGEQLPQVPEDLFSTPSHQPCSPTLGLRALPKARGTLVPFHDSVAKLGLGPPPYFKASHRESQLQLDLEKGGVCFHLGTENSC